jgi:hypothetical protein
MTNYAGIDYGMGKSNIDVATGIRYGIISQNSVSPYAMDDVYTQGEDLCYESFIEEVKASVRAAIVNAIDDHGGRVYGDLDVDDIVDMAEFDFYESSGPHAYSDGELSVQTTGDNDLFVFKSEYYTFAQFCSPCVPGAGNLDCPCEDGPKTYCLGPDWFDEDRPCPYPIYSVKTGEKVQ